MNTEIKAARAKISGSLSSRSNDDRSAGHGDNVEVRLFAGVSAAIDQDTEVLHFADDDLALGGQARLWVKHAAAKLIGNLIAEIGGPKSQLVIFAQLGLRWPAGSPIIAVFLFERLTVLPTHDHRNLALVLVGKDVARGLGELDSRIAVQKLKDFRKLSAVREIVPNVRMRGEIFIDDRFGENGTIGANDHDAKMGLRILGVGALQIGFRLDLSLRSPLKP
jgi:hypothetical protein